MQFDYMIALTDLDERTPQYFRDEIFAHAEGKALIQAREILHSGLDPSRRHSPLLRALIDVREHDNAG